MSDNVISEKTSAPRVLITCLPENKTAVIMILVALFTTVVFSIALAFLVYFIIHCVGETIVFLLFFLMIAGALTVFSLSDALWQIRGIEIISFDSKALYIEKKKLIRVKRTLPWYEIDEIKKYKKNEVLAFRDYFTLHGDINNPTLRLYCKNGKKTKFGVNLNEKRQKELIDAIMKLKQFYTNNSDI